MMHPSILAKRKAVAVNRIVQTTTDLIHHIGLDPVLADGLQPKGIKDPEVLDMLRLEGLAAFLDVLAELAGARPPEPIPSAAEETQSVTAVTETDTKPMDETLPGPVLEDLPAPVIEESVDLSDGGEQQPGETAEEEHAKPKRGTNKRTTKK